MTTPEQDKAVAVFGYVDTDANGHSGKGWYVWDDEYPDEGSVGAFETRKDAEEFARENDYHVQPVCGEEHILFCSDEAGENPLRCGLPPGHTGEHQDERELALGKHPKNLGQRR